MKSNLLLVVLGLAAALGFGDALAQKNQGGPTLVKNVDEPGRMPYLAYAEFNSTGCNTASDCANFSILSTTNAVTLFDAPIVPTGKRLIIKWVTANFTWRKIALQSSQNFEDTNARWQFSGPWFNGMSSGAFLTYGPGERPHVRIEGLNSCGPTNVFPCNVTISGYLIDASN